MTVHQTQKCLMKITTMKDMDWVYDKDDIKIKC